jgi:hypothetical protein
MELTLTTSNGEVTIAPAIPPTLYISPVPNGRRGTHLPAAECFHPDRDFFGDGEDVDGGTSDDGDAAGILEVEEEATELEDDPGSQADENEIG